MLSKKKRLNLSKKRSRDVFLNQVFKGLYFRVFSQKSGGEFKAAVVIPKATVAAAVDRNRIKRQTYAQIESWLKKNKEPAIEVVFLLNKGKRDFRGKQIKKEVEKGLEKAVS